MKRSFVACVLLFLAAAFSLSADTKVDCNKGESINTALAKLKKSGPNVVTISGTCTEDVVIVGFDDLRLVADGAAVLNPATATSKRVVLVSSSRLVSIDGFTMTLSNAVPQPWVAEFNGSSGCSIANMSITGGGGIRLQRSSNVAIADVAMHDAVIGIIVGNACQSDIRGVTIEFAPPSLGNVGIAVFSGSTAFVEGVTVSGYSTGVIAGGGQFFVPGATFFDSGRPVVIDHNRIGISANANGLVQLSAATQITNNGNGGDLTGGVVVNGGSVTALAGNPAFGSVEIRDNNGQGVLVLNNGTSSITGSFAFVSNNHLNGFAVVNGGIASFVNGVNVTGNGAKDLFCDDRGLITGSASVAGATKVQCTNMIPGPLPPGMPH